MKTGKKGRGERTCEALAVDRLATRAVEAREVAALEHELNTHRTNVSFTTFERRKKSRTLGMMRWKMLPLYPNPCWPVASSRKLRAVFGTTSS